MPNMTCSPYSQNQLESRPSNHELSLYDQLSKLRQLLEATGSKGHKTQGGDLLNLMLAADHLLELALADGVCRAGAGARECSWARGGGQALGASTPLLAPAPPVAEISLRAPFLLAQVSHAVHIHWVQLALHLQPTCWSSAEPMPGNNASEERRKGKYTYS